MKSTEYALIVVKLKNKHGFSTTMFKLDGQNQFFRELLEGTEINNITDEWEFEYKVNTYMFSSYTDRYQAISALKMAMEDCDITNRVLVWKALTDNEKTMWDQSSHNHELMVL